MNGNDNIRYRNGMIMDYQRVEDIKKFQEKCDEILRDMPMGVVAVTAADGTVTGQNISLLEEHFDRIMVTGTPDSDSAKAIASQMKDMDKLTYIVDNPIENANHIYTK